MHRSIEHLSGYEFLSQLDGIIDAFALAMLMTPPYQFEIHKKVTKIRIGTEIKNGARATISKNDQEIVGASIYSEIHLDTVAKKRLLPFDSKKTVQYLRELGKISGISDFIYLSITFAHPEHQKQGIAHQLRQSTIERLHDTYPNGVIVLTNHLSNNPAIIKSSEKLGFSPTGMKRCWEATPEISEGCDEYWMLVVQK